MTLDWLGQAVIECRRCPRLVEWRERVAIDKRAAFSAEEYWGRPVPGFGDPDARLVVVGLAPAAHGANRTGRMFTGDRSGEWLYRALHRSGFANQPNASSRDDGLVLNDTWITSAVKCAPPANRPTGSERAACSTWLDAELALLRHAEVYVALGGFGFTALWGRLGGVTGVTLPRPTFHHGLDVLVGHRRLLASYHPSQQNTFTKRLTEPMLDAVFARARDLLAT